MQRQNNGGFTLQWHITHRCNLRCEHCYQEDYTSFADRDALREVLDQYDAMLRACRFWGHINITGGEPLLHPDLFWLLEEAR
ncbi:MAG: radical SAM protein, partial [Ruminococcus sp.]|nr:radical SAM protein [Ruminococcus sp.]